MKKACKTPHLDEVTLQRLFITVFNKLISERDKICANLVLIKETPYGTAAPETE